MINYLAMWILKIKNPCKKCLVGPICREKSSDCDQWKEYSKLRRFLDRITDKLETIMVLGIAAIILFVVGSTFILGLYKWYEIFSVPIRKWLF